MMTGTGSSRLSLEGRVALVTGAGQGVGRGIAHALADAGASVAAVGRTLSKCETVAEELRERGAKAVAVRCDVKDRRQIDDCIGEIVDRFGGLDILVNNAQEVARGPLLELTDDDFARQWDSGPLATLRFMQGAHRHLRDGGVIVNLGSRAGVKPDPVDCGGYAAVKEAIRTLTRSAAHEWAGDGIRAVCVLPLATSPALEDLERDDRDAFERALASIPMRRFGDPERDIGAVVAFLVSDAAGYLTGITVPIDGGAAYVG